MKWALVRWAVVAASVAGAGLATHGAEMFHLPTPNQAIYQVGDMERYYVPTTGRTWESGTFGCVRSEGRQFHEGIDIRPVRRDRRGEAADPIYATADGTVAYVNPHAHLSNYGKYLILRHVLEGVELYSLYAHLSQIAPELTPGRPVRGGQVIGIMGRTANTREGISRERAHLHFELALLLNDQFNEWFRKNHPGERNDHGVWNGQNLAGLDPTQILVRQRRPDFSLLQFVRGQTELCRIWVRQRDFSFVRRYAVLMRRNPLAEKEGVAGYELAFTYNGLPFELTPRAPSETRHLGETALLSVNAAEFRRQPCRKLVEERGGQFALSAAGQKYLQLLLFSGR
ncbi:MAG: M23 family metallopeptidase [Verrucomicrobiae bacterium]|nr:M23 family metallopeptidase [Verrucomicrobiae bacterium]